MEKIRGYDTKVGVPYDDLIARGYTNGDIRECRGASGRKLMYELTPKKIAIYDARYPVLNLQAQRDRSTVEYNLRTRAVRGSAMQRDYGVVNRQGIHLDMNAKHFVFWSLAYFEEVVGTRITAIQARWYDISDNYQQFIDAFDQTQNERKAAVQVWSARTFAQADFTLQSVNTRARDHDGEVHIAALFTRK